MRMRKVSEKVPTLEELIGKFLLVKQSQHTGELAMRDYRNCLVDFLKHSRNSISYELLEQDGSVMYIPEHGYIVTSRA